MPVSLSVKHVPEDVVKRLRDRARRNHRSLQGELLTILESSSRVGTLSVKEFAALARSLKFRTPDESVRMIREDRDSR